MKQKLQLPECGIYVGSGIYPTDTDTLLCTMLGHYTWQAQYFGPMQILDKILEDNQGNLAQVWGVPRGFSPRLLGEWLYALDEIGIDIPAPDWEQYKNLTTDCCMDLFAEHKSRFGAGYVRFIREAKKRNIYTCLIYTSSEPEWIQKLNEVGGDHYLGYDFGERYNIGLDDAKSILAETGELSLGALADRLIKRVRDHVNERHKAGWGNVMATSSNFHLDYEIYGGAEVPLVEDFAFCNLNVSSGFSRGLYRQFDLPFWGSHLAHEHYSWLPNESPYRMKQFRLGCYLKYMAGSKMIINESGNWFVEHTLAPDSPKFQLPQSARKELGIIGWGAAKEMMSHEPARLKTYLEEARPYFHLLDYNSDVCRAYRKEISDFWNYVKEHGTPAGQPEVTIALAKGNYDFTSSRFNKNYAIGGLADVADENPSWFEGTPEHGWTTAFKVFFPLPEVTGKNKNIQLSGTPFGQTDIVSFVKDDVTAEILNKNYKALLFTGWNTCSEKQYRTLVEYVRNGGILFTSIPQLCTNQTRNLAYPVEELVNGGDFSELCGMKVKSKGDRFYWATAPIGEKRLGFQTGRRFGIIATPIGNVEVTDPKLDVLVVDDEVERPLITMHKLGKGEVYFLNSWAYPGAMDADDGPGGTNDSPGLIGYLYRFIAKKCRGTFYITDDQEETASECNYIAFSYFPDAKKVCMLNIDSDRVHSVYLHGPKGVEFITMKPGEFKQFPVSI